MPFGAAGFTHASAPCARCPIRARGRLVERRTRPISGVGRLHLSAVIGGADCSLSPGGRTATLGGFDSLGARRAEPGKVGRLVPGIAADLLIRAGADRELVPFWISRAGNAPPPRRSRSRAQRPDRPGAAPERCQLPSPTSRCPRSSCAWCPGAASIPWHPTHWSGLFSAICVLVSVTGEVVNRPPP
jgi:hypothetical protein